MTRKRRARERWAGASRPQLFRHRRRTYGEEGVEERSRFHVRTIHQVAKCRPESIKVCGFAATGTTVLNDVPCFACVVPLGTLRAALAYPSAQVSYKDEELAAALQSTGLDRLTSSVDQVARWDKELSFDEQQLLVFSRMLLHRPHCVVIDEALDTLDDSTRKCIISLFKDKLKDTAVINIGRTDTNHRFFTRTLRLLKESSGRCFIPDLSAHGFGGTADAARNKTTNNKVKKAAKAETDK